jgi:hypothetical protein
MNRRDSIWVALFGLTGCAAGPLASIQDKSQDKQMDVCPNGHSQVPIYLGDSGDYKVFTCSRCSVMYVSSYEVPE